MGMNPEDLAGFGEFSIVNVNRAVKVAQDDKTPAQAGSLAAFMRTYKQEIGVHPGAIMTTAQLEAGFKKWAELQAGKDVMLTPEDKATLIDVIISNPASDLFSKLPANMRGELSPDLARSGFNFAATEATQEISPAEERQRQTIARDEFRERLKLAVTKPDLMSEADARAEAEKLGLDFGMALEQAARDAALEELDAVRAERLAIPTDTTTGRPIEVDPAAIAAGKARMQARQEELVTGFQGPDTPAPTEQPTLQAAQMVEDILKVADAAGGLDVLLSWAQSEEGRTTLQEEGVNNEEYVAAIRLAIYQSTRVKTQP